MISGKIGGCMRNQGYDFIRFCAMSAILLFHFCGRVYDAKHPDFLYPILYFPTGQIAVALFFILSGSVLIENYKGALDVNIFYKKRLTRILLPQMIAFTFCAILLYTCGILDTSDKVGLFLSFLGLDFCNIWTYLGISRPWIVGAWFTTVIIFLYLVFPYMRKMFLKHRFKSSLVVYTVFILNMKFQIMSDNNGWFSYTNAIAAFWTGMIFNEYRDMIYKNKVLSFYLPLCICALLAGNQFVIKDFMYTFTFVYAVVLYVLLYNIKYSSRVTNFICKYNFELYLVHNTIYTVLISSIVNYDGGFYQLIAIFIFMNAVVFFVAYHLKNIVAIISEKFFN